MLTNLLKVANSHYLDKTKSTCKNDNNRSALISSRLPADKSTMVLFSELELRNIVLSVNYTIKTLKKEVKVNND